MRTKKSLKFRVSIFITIFAVLCAVGVAIYSNFAHLQEADAAKAAFIFEFDGTKASGWFAGDGIDGSAINTDAAPTSAKLADTTRIIAQGTAEKPTGNCFLQYSYWADTTKEMSTVLAELSAPADASTTGSFSLEPVATVLQTMKTTDGDVGYDLYQYTTTGPDTAGMSTGKEVAAFKVSGGYVSIVGYCKTAEELAITLPVFDAVSFKEK